jgi:hypothetical protein
MPAPRPEPPSVRFLAFMIWGAMLAGVLVLAAVAALLGPGIRENQWEPFPAGFPLSAALTNMVLLPGSRLIPRALKAELPTLTKNVIATAIAEVGALYAAVAWMLTGSTHAVAGLIMGLSGIAICYPNDSRWRALGGTVAEDGPGKDRSGGPGFGGGR